MKCTGNIGVVGVIALLVMSAVIGTVQLRIRSKISEFDRMLIMDESYYLTSLAIETHGISRARDAVIPRTLSKTSDGTGKFWNRKPGILATRAELLSPTIERVCGTLKTLNGMDRTLCGRRTAVSPPVDPLYSDPTFCLEAKHNRVCPPGYAVFGFGDPANSHTPSTIDTIAYCCKVPDDLLMTDNPGDVAYRQNDCRANGEKRVVTGGTTSAGQGIASCEDSGVQCLLRCTKINEYRYRLGNEINSVFYERVGSGSSSGFGDAIRKNREELPLAMRFSAGRRNLIGPDQLGPDEYKIHHDTSSCIPQSTTGVLMTKKSSKYCHLGTEGMFGVKILYTGQVAGDVANQPVQLLKNCSGNTPVNGSFIHPDGYRVWTERYSNLSCQ